MLAHEKTKASMITISDAYGVLKVETFPSEYKTINYINLLADQIRYQALTEIAREFEPPKFHFGLRWGTIVPENTNIAPMSQEDIVTIQKAHNDSRYAYSYKDQFGEKLPLISELKPIIDEIENALNIDMSAYDAMIGNIYLDGFYIPPHKDTTESKTSSQYPIIVYTIGNNSALGIWDGGTGNKVLHEYNLYSYLYPDLKKPTNEIRTHNGTIYTIGFHGRKRFDLIHATPNPCFKPLLFPPITLPDNECVNSNLRDKTITNYTITLTFRRAQDVSIDMPSFPKCIKD
jgi:hypothetical protein